MKHYILSLELVQLGSKTKKTKEGQKLLYATYRTKVSKDNIKKIFDLTEDMMLLHTKSLEDRKEQI